MNRACMYFFLTICIAGFSINCNVDPNVLINDGGDSTAIDGAKTNTGATTQYYTVGGNVTGLQGSGLLLQNNGSDMLSIASDGPFSFVTTVADAGSYSVSVLTQPTGLSQICVVTNGAGSVAGADVTNILVNCMTNTYMVSGNVTGLQGSGLMLMNNGADLLSIGIDGTFTFLVALQDGASYSISVNTQPSGLSQTCSVANGSGVISGANITNVLVTCTTNHFTVSGTISGLAGSGLVLQNNLGDDLFVSANGTYSFSTALIDGAGYSVTIASQPIFPNQYCTLSGGSGVINGANPNAFVVNCSTNNYTVGGTITGLSGSGLVLQNNGMDDLAITADGSFTFATPLPDGSSYNITVLSHPVSLAQTCTVSGGIGNLAGSDITAISVNCSTDNFTISGTINGLAGTGLVLQNNGADDLIISSDGIYTFAGTLPDGAIYDVTILSQPSSPNQNCVISSGTGLVSGSNVSGFVVNCATNTYTIGGTVSGLTGSGFVLQNNGGDNLALSANGTFTFATPLSDGSAFSVTVLTQPGGAPNNIWQTCSVTGGSGNLNGGNIANVSLNCVTNTYTVTVRESSVYGTTVTLEKYSNFFTESLDVTSYNGVIAPGYSGGSGVNDHVFTIPVESGKNYTVYVLGVTPYQAQSCSLTGDTGTVTNSNVIVTMDCWNNYSQVSAGVVHTISIRNGDNTLWAWNASLLATGQYHLYGRPVQDTYSTPVQIGFDTWTSISAGSLYFLAIRSDGTLWGWGKNTYGQIGDATWVDKTSLVQIGTSTWQRVSAGLRSDPHSLGIQSDGTLWSWGRNSFGQLGDNTNVDKNMPVQIGTSTWSEISAGAGLHSLGIQTNGTLWAWGGNGVGQLGDNTTVDKWIPNQIGTATDWIRISAGGAHSVGIRYDTWLAEKTLWAWGRNISGQLGDGTNTDSLIPKRIGNSVNWLEISAGGSHTIGIKKSDIWSENEIWTWGDNVAGQLGDGTMVDRNTPTLIYFYSESLNQVSAGYINSFVVGTAYLRPVVWAWGDNSSFQLGLGDFTARLTPTLVQ